MVRQIDKDDPRSLALDVADGFQEGLRAPFGDIGQLRAVDQDALRILLQKDLGQRLDGEPFVLMQRTGQLHDIVLTGYDHGASASTLRDPWLFAKHWRLPAVSPRVGAPNLLRSPTPLSLSGRASGDLFRLRLGGQGGLRTRQGIYAKL